MKRTIFVVLILLLVAAAIGYRFMAPAESAAAGPGDKRPPVPVRTEVARHADLPVQLKVIGRAEASESVTVRSRVDGQIKSVRFDDGQHVAAGDVLATLDDADFRARVAQAEANLARDQAQLIKAKADLERYANPKTRAYISEAQLSQVQATADAAAATVRADEAELTLARLQLDYATIRAPIGGVAGSRLLSPGALVKSNDTAIAVINTIRPMDVSFSVPETNLPALRSALRGGPVKTLVTVSGDQGAPMEGLTRFIDNAVDPATGTIRVKATLANRDERLTSGQFVSVQLTLDTLRDAIVVPGAAVQQGPQGSFVYIVQPDGTAQLRPVQILLSNEGMAAVSSVAAGEQVVTDGHVRLTPGAKVKPAGGSAQAQSQPDEKAPRAQGRQ